MAQKPNLVIFVRAPLLGRVKRRLALGIGAIAARRFYTDTTDLLLRRVGSDQRWRTWLAVTPDRFANKGRFWPGTVQRFGQGDGDLGERMASALDRFGHAPVVIVGSDIPDIDARHIDAAFRVLGAHDAVLGPAADGGYWLVGARDPLSLPDAFQGVRWSGPHALADTLDNLKGCRVALLETLTDVDDADDLKQRSLAMT